MQDYLHRAQEEADLLGTTLDDNTQLLIDQSKELGIWKDKGKSATDLLTESMGKLVDKVSKLIDELRGIPTDVNVAVNVNRTTTTDGTEASGPTVPQAEGGLGYAAGPMTFTTKGNEWYAFSGENKPFLPMTEAPRTTTAVADEVADLADAVRRSSGINVTFAITTLDASDFQAVVEQKVFPALVNQLRRGKGLTQMQDVLQVR
jgi:hypothetical protein